MTMTSDSTHSALRPAYGHVEVADFRTSTLTGYVFIPGHVLDSAEAYIDGVLAGTALLEPRPDISARFRFTSFAPLGPTGYHVQVDSRRLSDGIHRVTIVGRERGQALARMHSIVFPEATIPDIPVPPPRLIELTQGDHHGEAYKRLGFRYYLQLRDVIARHRDFPTLKRMLDWGCGSGRIASCFIAEPGGPQVFGGDYNHEAADWCRVHLPGGEFRALDPLPPLPYPDAHFDLIVAMGVVGGCGKAEWEVWLPDLRRVLARHGLLLITVQGVFAATALYPAEQVGHLRREGFFDGAAFDADHPPPSEDMRYRGGTYLSRAYVAETWLPYFHVLEHLEGEINSDLDLVVAERKD